VSRYNTFDIGDLVELTATFTDPDTGDPVDPDNVVCTVKKRTEVVEVAASGRDGVYTAQVDIDVSGWWHYSFDGEGSFQASAEQKFLVRDRTVPR
jgi:hypothetical protein